MQKTYEQGLDEGFVGGIETAVNWIVKNFSLDCFDCKINGCFYTKGTNCRAEIIKAIKENTDVNKQTRENV